MKRKLTKEQAEAFALRLIQQREKTGLHQGQLAERLGLKSRGAIAKIEAANYLPSLVMFADMCEFYGVTMDEMWHGSDTNKNVVTCIRNRKME